MREASFGCRYSGDLASIPRVLQIRSFAGLDAQQPTQMAIIVLATRGASKKPDSSAKTKWALSRAAFFLPVAIFPASSARWPCRSAPAHVVQASGESTQTDGGVGQRVEMARHAKGSSNHLRHSLCRPQFCAVAVGNGALQ